MNHKNAVGAERSGVGHFRSGRIWACLAVWASLAAGLTGAEVTPGKVMPGNGTPNVVMIFIDDMAYADIGPFGAGKYGIETPNLDRMAKEGIKFTRFYVAQPVCSASRAALMTGCYPNRVGIHGALGPKAQHGLNANEMTMAEVFKQRGYATGMVGKWHLGSLPQFLPVHHGFDEYFGLPYSNDMWPHHPEMQKLDPATRKRRQGYPPLPLIDGDKVVKTPVEAADQEQLTTQYTERAVRFIEKNKERPFFLYVAHSMTHVPLYVSKKFKGKSARGLFGDVVMEVDWSVGEILAALKRTGVDEKTLVVFTSDNGPWLSYGDHAGSAGAFREGKGSCWEGGVREPFLARWPGVIPAGAECREPAMTIDLLPTFARLIGAELPKHKIDGLDIWPLLAGDRKAKNPHEAYYFYYENNQLQAVMSGKWKLQLPHAYRTMKGQAPGGGGMPGKYVNVKIETAQLYDLEADEGETKDVAAANPAEVKRLEALAEKMREDLGDSLTKRKGSGVREPGRAVE